MQTVLSQLNSVPGVVGSLVCDLHGQLVAQVFPPVFDVAALEEMSRTLADGATALDLSSETAELLDFRFKEGRLLARPFTGSMLVVVCTKATNVQFLMLSVSAAVTKLDKLRPATALAPTGSPALAAAASPATPAARAAPGPKKVAASASGLDELRRRLGEAAAAPDPDGVGSTSVESFATPSEGFPQAKQDDARPKVSKTLQWWEGMS